MLKIHKAIRIIMIEKNITGVDLARILGVNRSNILKNVGEHSNPTMATISKYADALDVKVSELIVRAEGIKQ
jgi:transcriptional regulator with XRE-family HTH domain